MTVGAPLDIESLVPPTTSIANAHVEDGPSDDVLEITGLYNDLVSVFRWEDINAILPVSGWETTRKMVVTEHDGRGKSW